MDFLKAEIERKKKRLAEKGLVGPNKKFFRKADLLKIEEEEYKRNCKESDSTQEKKEDSNEPSTSTNLPAQPPEEERSLPRAEVVKRLRDRNEPIRLFGETDLGAFKRLRHLELLEPEIDRGFRNDFQEALEQADQRYLDELLRPQPTGNKDDPTEVAVEDQDLTMDHIHELARGLGRSSKAHDANVILTFLKFILKLWGEHLNSRSEEEKGSVHGRIASATYTQTKSYIRPLFKKLRNNTVPDDILEHLVEIVTHMLSRNYVKANDAYLQMAIGNAPWPIGVTMVGIHARTGREKIFSKNIAHVLNDETQRKFIQALKRLMTQCQRIFPTDPSRSVEYNA